MAIDVDKTAATKALQDSYTRCLANPVQSCPIRATVDFVMAGRNCLTYRYIMLTALLAKHVEPHIDILSLQAGDSSAGAYDARSLASKVVYPFQKLMLGNVLDGSNSDPLVNKPGRFMRLRKSNPAAGGDPTKALSMLCDSLPTVKTSAEAGVCVDYIVTKLLSTKRARDAKLVSINYDSSKKGVFVVRDFMSHLLDQGFGGSALVLVATALYAIQYGGKAFTVVPHPVNQSGSSSKQFSDLDVYLGGVPFLATELKDKPFTARDVDHAAETAFSAGSPGLLFVAGRQSSFASQPPTYFAKARDKYAKKGMAVGVTSIDSLMDTILVSHTSIDAASTIEVIRSTSEAIGALEAQMWVYENMG